MESFVFYAHKFVSSGNRNNLTVFQYGQPFLALANDSG